MEIRPMQAGDAEVVAQLDVQAFSGYWRGTGRGGSIPRRTSQNILACLKLNPQGCLIAADPEPIGYLFSRVWGEIGWIGTFGVHPEQHGRGVGKGLLLSAVDQLKLAGCRVIGLETMPDSAYNIGFYARLGFMPVHPTISLDKPTERQVDYSGYTQLNQPGESAKLAALSQIGQAAWPGLDLSVEAQNAASYGWGDTLLIGWPEAWAAAILRTTPKRVGEDEPFCEVRSLVVRPTHQNRFREALLAVEDYALSHDLPEVYLHINAYHHQALQEAIEAGYRVSHAMLRMLLTSGEPGPLGIDLSRWAM